MDTPRIEQVLETLAEWQWAEHKLDIARANYEGCSFGWAHAELLAAEKEARHSFATTFDAYIDSRVNAVLTARGLIPTEVTP